MNDSNSEPPRQSSNITWQAYQVKRQDREQRNGHRSAVVWLTGLPSAGKSTLAYHLDDRLHRRGYASYVCDGDNLRHGLCGDLGFSAEDRRENVRRVAEVCRLFVDAGLITLAALVSPYRADRDRARALFDPQDFIEVYCQCPLAICEQRDVKGLYKRARAGDIPELTGISAPYEEPEQPELVLETALVSAEQGVQIMLDQLLKRGILPHIGE